MNPSIVITGISGFVGLNLKDYLRKNGSYRLTGSSRVLSKLDPIRPELQGTITYDDILNRECTFNIYVHLAGKVFDLEDKSDPSEYYDANFELARKLFDRFAADKHAEKFIFLSTIHALTERAKSDLTETYKPVPVTPYGESKLKAEQYMLDHCPEGKRVYILRPSMIHGPGTKGSLNLLFKFISKGLPYPMGAYNNKRSFVSIENLCFVINELIDHDIEGGLYHVADDKPTYTHDLVQHIAELTGRKVKIWYVHPKIIKFLAKVGNKIPLPLNDYRYNKLTEDFIVSNKKIKKAIGKPLPVSAEEGIQRTLESFIR